MTKSNHVNPLLKALSSSPSRSEQKSNPSNSQQVPISSLLSHLASRPPAPSHCSGVTQDLCTSHTKPDLLPEVLDEVTLEGRRGWREEKQGDRKAGWVRREREEGGRAQAQPAPPGAKRLLPPGLDFL